MAYLPNLGPPQIKRKRINQFHIGGLSFTAAGLPPGLTMDSTTSRVTGTIAGYANGDYGSTCFVKSAQDPFEASSVPFTWTVNASPLDISNLGDGKIGLQWVELYHVDALGAAKNYLWSSVDLADPGSYYGGYKEGRVVSWGDVGRGLSDERGIFESTEFTFVVADTDRLIRTLLDSKFAKVFQNRMVIIRLIDDESRRGLLTPYLLVRGVIRDYRPRSPLHFEFVARDQLSSLIGGGATQKEIPSRKFTREDFPDLPESVSGLPVPICYGKLSDEAITEVTVSDVQWSENVTYEIVGEPGTTTYLYTVTALRGAGSYALTLGNWFLHNNIPYDSPDLLVVDEQNVADPALKAVVPGYTGANMSTWGKMDLARQYWNAILPTGFKGFYGTSGADGVDPTNPAEDNNHYQEFIWGQVLITNGPSPQEWGPNRYIRIKWNNVGEQQREAWWYNGVHLPGGPPAATSRVYGRTVDGPQQLLVGLGPQGAKNQWDDDMRPPRAPQSSPPGNNVHFEGDPHAAGTKIKIDSGRGIVPVIYVGKRTIGSSSFHEFVIAGHAVRKILGWYLGGVRQPTAPADELDRPEQTWLVPGYKAFHDRFGTPKLYVEYNSRRYASIFLVADSVVEPTVGPIVQHHLDGTAPITVNIEGIEFAADGTGALIDQLADIYKHFAVNFVFQEWQSGGWLTEPIWAAGLDPVGQQKAQIDLASFDRMRAVHQRRLAGGYPGAIMFGATTSRSVLLNEALAQLNLSCDCQCGFNRHSQFFVTIFDESVALVDNANLYTQVDDILKASMDVEAETEKVENEIEFVWGRRYATTTIQTSTGGYQAAEWLKEKTVKDAESIALLRETRRGPRLELWGVRDDAVAEDIARRRMKYYKEPPTPVRLATTVKGLKNELGDIVRVTTIEGGGANGWVGRPLRIQRFAVNPGKFQVTWDAIDVWRLYSTTFILGDETAHAASWTAADSRGKLRGYLCDESTGAFSNGEEGKRLG